MVSAQVAEGVWLRPPGQSRTHLFENADVDSYAVCHTAVLNVPSARAEPPENGLKCRRCYRWIRSKT